MDDFSLALKNARTALQVAGEPTTAAGAQARMLAGALERALGNDEALEHIGQEARGQVVQHAVLMTQAFNDGRVGLGLGHANALLGRLNAGIDTGPPPPEYVNSLSGMPLSGMKRPWDP